MLSIGKGYDPRYLTRQVGKGAENYYLSATAEHGEPPGVWWGEGARALGLEPGSEIDGAVFERLYEHFHDPRDPDFYDPSVPDEDKARLGRKKSRFQSWQEIYAKKLAAEPEASPERREVLKYQAKGQSRQALIHLDLTFSPPKSVTLVHAGLRAAARRAEEAGNAEQAAKYREAADAVWDGVMAGATASLQYLQEHAGEARAGYHGAKTAGRTTGRWVRAGGWVVGQFRQHTNREGDPQLHVHQAVLNRQLCEDGEWRTLDSRAIFRARAAAAAHGERVMEEYLTRRLGLEFRSRPDGQGREVVGVDPALIAEFSSRRAQVTADLEKRIEAYIEAHGRPPSPRVLFKLAQDSAKATKAAKTKSHAPSPAEQLKAWEERTTAQELEDLAKVPAKTLGRINPAEQPAPELADAEIQRVLEAAIADVQRDTAEWTRYQLTRAINRHLPDYLGGLHPERVEALLEQLTDMALVPGAAGPVRALEAPEVVDMPEDLRRPDGRSVYLAQCAGRYTTATQLDREAALMEAALRREAPRLEAERAAALVGMSVEEAKRAALRGEAVPEVTGHRPFADQADAIVGILTSGRNVDVMVGAAGTGKSFTVAKLADIWRAEHGTPVLGLTTSQNAAAVLKREGLDHAMNIERWLRKVARGEESLTPEQLIVVDEASMVTTEHLERIQRLADDAGCKVVWTGDHGQLSAPGAGGAMRRLVDVAGAHRLTTMVRFREQWERDASVKLRDGLAEALADYDHHGRLIGGSREEMETAAVNAYLADYLAGKRTLLLTGTNEQAAQLAGRIRDELVALGLVDRRGVALRDGNAAGAGDLIMARRNTEIEDADELTNRDVLQVELIAEDGTITARRLGEDGQPGETIDLPPSYVSHHMELAYAGTVHAAQGRTVDTCHGIVDESATRESFYVQISRGRDGNWAYVVTDDQRESDLRTGPEQAAERGAALLRDAVGAWSAEQGAPGGEADARPDYIAVLTNVLETEEADQTAIEAMLEEAERPRSLAHLGAIMTDQAREQAPLGYIARAQERGALSEADAARLRKDPALGSLGRLLRQIEMSGRDPDRILDAAITERELDSADSAAQVLIWRIQQAAEARGIDLDRLEVAEEQIGASWRERYAVPTPDPERARLLEELAAAAEARQAELGERAVQQQPAWLVEALGEVPEEPGERVRWAQRAGAVLAYREQYGHEAETDPIGPAPSRTSPEQRAAWWTAYDALGRPDASREITGATDGELWVMRAAYEREAQWAPPYVADELRQVSREAHERAAEAVRLRARAAAVADQEAAAGLLARAQAQQTLADAAAARQQALERVHEARQAWAEATRDTAMQAMRADAELRRREHIDHDLLPPLHADTADAAERLAQQREAAARAEAERDRPAICPGQQTLDLGPEVERATAWEPTTDRQAPVPEAADRDAERDREILEEMQRAAERRAWARGEREEPPAADPRRETTPSRDDGRQAAAEAGPEADRKVEDRDQVDGQTVLDVFGTAAHVAEVGEDRQLAEAVDKATVAAAIAAQRQADQEEERTRQADQERAERAEQERRREHETERAKTERTRLEEREADRGIDQEARTAWEIASLGFPSSVYDAVRASDQQRGHDPYRPGPAPSQDRSHGRDEGLGL